MDLTNVVSALNSTAPLQVTQIHFKDLGWLFGLLSIAFAIWFGFGDKLRDYLGDSKRSLIDEKIAMLYGYCLRIASWNPHDNEGIRIETLKIRADIRSIGRIKRAIPQDQKTALIFAKEELLTKLRSNNHFNAQAHDIATEFAANLW
jgi:hypothetical protein